MCLALATWSSGASASPVFVDRAPGLGLTHSYDGGWEHFVGGGVAAFDCNDDGFAELYLAGGTSPATLLRNRTRAPGAALDFTADTPAVLALTQVTGAYPLDIDSDGHTDLVILRVGTNLVLRGGPDCSFTPFPAALGFDGGENWTTAFSAMWERENALPTLAFGNYVNRDDPDGPFEACAPNRLMRPDGKSYAPPQPLSPGYCALSLLFSDWGRNGRQDLRVSNDRHYYVRGGSEQLWAMESEPRLYTRDEGWTDLSIWGMGIASRDVNADGYPDVFLTSMGDQKLQMFDPTVPGPHFRDVRYAFGTTAHRPYTGGDGRPSTGWHVAFGDVDNDGHDDIFIAKGNVEQMPDSAMTDPNNLLLRTGESQFTEVGLEAGIATMHRSRGAALLDLNGDGLLDLAVVNRRAPVEIHQNVTADPGAWVSVTLRQPAPNRDAIGAWIEIEAPNLRLIRELTVGGGHAGGTYGPHHFGLGEIASARIRVIWPDGTPSAWQTVGVNRHLTLTRNGTDLRIGE